jgi:3-oxoacyl-[acyl-carrier protein] reductase
MVVKGTTRREVIMDLGLGGKAVMVTGASGAIGGAIARAFALEGARVIVHYNRGKERAERLVAELGPDHLALQADLTDEAGVQALFSIAQERLGPIGVLVANAGGWANEYVDVWQMDLVRWRQTIDQDLTSVFLTCREFLRVVQRERDGSIVIVSSHAGIFGEAGDTDYAAAKGAINAGLIPSLKSELARLASHGRINAVAPGWTVTPAVAEFVQNPDFVRDTLRVVASRRLSLPDDIANAAVFLSSDIVARQITGQVIVVNGGQDGRILWSEEEALEHWSPHL